MNEPQPAPPSGRAELPGRSRRRQVGVLAAIAALALAVGAGGFWLAAHVNAPDKPRTTRSLPVPTWPAPTAVSDFPSDLLDSKGVYREALLLQVGADETRTWEALAQAALSKRTIALEIAVPNFPGRIERPSKDSVVVSVPPVSTDPLAARADRRGGEGFDIELEAASLQSGCPYGSFFRITGLFDVAHVTSAARDRFELTTRSAKPLDFPEGTSDDARCRGGDGRAATLALVETAARDLTDQNYAEVKSRWIASPRVWWAVRDRAWELDGGPALPDPLIEACWPWAV